MAFEIFKKSNNEDFKKRPEEVLIPSLNYSEYAEEMWLDAGELKNGEKIDDKVISELVELGDRAIEALQSYLSTLSAETDKDSISRTEFDISDIKEEIETAKSYVAQDSSQ